MRGQSVRWHSREREESLQERNDITENKTQTNEHVLIVFGKKETKRAVEKSVS